MLARFLIDIQVLAINIRDDRKSRGVVQKRSAKFIGFKYKIVARATPEIAAVFATAKLFKVCSYDDCRVKPASNERERRERGRRAFTVCAGDGDRLVLPSEFAHGLGVGEHPHAPTPRFLKLRIGRRYGLIYDHKSHILR